MPTLLTFDIFGTVLDWREGLRASLAASGRTLSDADFERIIDAQGVDEQRRYRRYRDIVADSLVSVLGLPREQAEAIGADVGRWPLFADSIEGMRRLRRVAPCMALTNSDKTHGEQVQATLGFALDDWLCAEESRLYKPDPRVWQLAAERRRVSLDRNWWHVSAYGDYDLEVARSLGLTCVFVRRPHHRAGPADVTVGSLLELAERLEQAR
jgi:putative hydrolase of the HAD superfamily